MLLNLREIIGVPGGKVRFQYEPDLSGVAFGSVVRVISPSRTAGSVVNSAGVLTLSAIVDAELVCVCARCLREFNAPVSKRINALILEGDSENAEAYFLQGDEIDVDEILTTEMVLDIDQRLLCREDCKGICQKCGTDLNAEPCTCKAETDPRLAVLGQLLDNE